MDDVKLLPCPFCGGKAEWKSGGPGCAWISCTQCPAETADGSIPRIAAAWNTRTPASDGRADEEDGPADRLRAFLAARDACDYDDDEIDYIVGETAEDVAHLLASDIRAILARADKAEALLAEAHAAGLREAAAWHDAQIAELDEQIARNDRYRKEMGRLGQVSEANEYCRTLIANHRISRDAILARAAEREGGNQ